MYTFYSKELNENVLIHFLDIDIINQDFENLITSSIQYICGGRYTEDSLTYFKRKLANFFLEKLKDDKRTAMGAIAEFIIHIHLQSQFFEQECMFFNLEERSIKKGFDGYYTKGKEQWIMESKSSGNSTNKHQNKVREAYTDLKKKVETNVPNDPWRNAYNHMCHMDVNTRQSVVKEVRKFSEDFQKNKFQEIKNFNIIPCSTLYLGNTWTPINKDQLELKLLDLLKEFEYNKLHIICVNNKDYQQIINLITT